MLQPHQLQAASFAPRATQARFGKSEQPKPAVQPAGAKALKQELSKLVENVTNLLEAPEVQDSFKKTNEQIAQLAEHKDLPPIEKVKLNIFRQMLPTSHEKVTQLTNGMAKALHTYNQALSKPDTKQQLVQTFSKLAEFLKSPEWKTHLNQAIQKRNLAKAQMLDDALALSPSTKRFQATA